MTEVMSRQELALLEGRLKYYRLVQQKVHHERAEATDVLEYIPGGGGAFGEKAFVNHQIAELIMRKAGAVIVDQEIPAGSIIVTTGSHVSLEDLTFGGSSNYQLVVPTESDPVNGRISNQSLLGLALMSKVVGDIITIRSQEPYDVQVTSVS